VSHCLDKYRQRQRCADPEALRHVEQFDALLVIRTYCYRLRFQRHAALGAIAGMFLLHLGVHRARVDGFAPRFGLDGRPQGNRRFTQGFFSE
jgi:hypothetical protein